MKRSSFEYDAVLKLVVVGDHGVGKTTLVSNLSKGKPTKNPEPTIGVEFNSVSVTIPKIDKHIKLQIWDTAGQEKFKSITRIYYRNAKCAIVVFDITRRESFNKLKSWIEEVRYNMKSNCTYNLFIVGNKLDREELRTVTKEEANEFAKSFGISYVETSSFLDKSIELKEKVLIPLATNSHCTLEQKEKIHKSLEVELEPKISVYGCNPRKKCCS